MLVAIAVPLFVGEIARARETTFEANKRAARGAVIAAILKDGAEKFDGTAVYYDVKVDTKTGAIGAISKNADATEETADYEAWQKTGSSDSADGTITIKIEKTDLEISGT